MKPQPFARISIFYRREFAEKLYKKAWPLYTKCELLEIHNPYGTIYKLICW